METLIGKLLFKPYKLMDFLSLMDSEGNPFSFRNGSYVSDFFLSTSKTARDTYVMFGLPTINVCAEQIISTRAPELYYDIKCNNGEHMGRYLQGLSYRDIAIEYFNFIYCNAWELHTALEIGEAQRFALSLLEKHGYIRPEIMDPKNHVYHSVMYSELEKIGYCKFKTLNYTDVDISVNVPHIRYEALPSIIQKEINGYIEVSRSSGKPIQHSRDDVFWRYDTSHRIIGYIV